MVGAGESTELWRPPNILKSCTRSMKPHVYLHTYLGICTHVHTYAYLCVCTHHLWNHTSTYLPRYMYNMYIQMHRYVYIHTTYETTRLPTYLPRYMYDMYIQMHRCVYKHTTYETTLLPTYLPTCLGIWWMHRISFFQCKLKELVKFSLFFKRANTLPGLNVIPNNNYAVNNRHSWSVQDALLRSFVHWNFSYWH